MPGLWWSYHERYLPNVAATGVLSSVGWSDGDPILPALKRLIALRMTNDLGFTDVRTNNWEVAGGKFDGAVWTSIAYVPFGDGDLGEHEMVMTAADGGADAKSVTEELVFLLDSLIPA